MWIYQEPEEQKTTGREDSSGRSVKQAVNEIAEKALPIASDPCIRTEQTHFKNPSIISPCRKDSVILPQNATPSPAYPITPQNRPERQSKNRKNLFSPASRDCILLAAACLSGNFIAGALQAMCSAEEMDILIYYFDCWQSLFTVHEVGQVIRLFWVELATLFGVLSVFLLLGLSALGQIPIYLFAMFYGIGVGLLSMRVLSPAGSLHAVILGVLCGIPTALSTGILCLFGVSALRISSRLYAASFGRKGIGKTEIHPEAAAGLLRQFAQISIALVPLCGVSTCIACLESQFR